MTPVRIFYPSLLTVDQLKPAVTAALQRLLDPIQKEFTSNPEWQEVSQPLKLCIGGGSYSNVDFVPDREEGLPR